jgi:rhomboid family GlyGly-CTERM serine protease
MKSRTSDSPSQSLFRSANCDARYGAALLAILALILALAALGSGARNALQYERLAVAHGQWWRLVGAHLVHLGWEHALLNGAGLALLWVLFAREFTPRRWLWILFCSTAAIDAGLWFLRPTVEWYLGASGVLHGVLAAGACALYRRGDGVGAALMLALIVRLVYEQQSGRSLLMGDLPLLADAHLFGVLGGLIGAFVPRPAAEPV